MACLVIAGRKDLNTLTLNVIAVVLLVSLTQQVKGIPFLLLTIIPALAMGLAASRSLWLGRILAFGFLGGALGFVLYWIWLLLVGSHLGPHGFERGFAISIKDGLKMIYDTPEIAQMYNSQGITRELMYEAYRSLLHTLATLRPSIYVGESWIQSCLTMIALKFFGGKGYLISLPFERQRMPWQLDWIVIAGLALWLTGSQWGVNWAEMSGGNLLFLLAVIAFYYGCSTVFYAYKHWKIRVWLLVILIFVSLYYPVQSFILIALVGLFDPLLDYRNLDQKRGKTT